MTIALRLQIHVPPTAPTTATTTTTLNPLTPLDHKRFGHSKNIRKVAVIESVEDHYYEEPEPEPEPEPPQHYFPVAQLLSKLLTMLQIFVIALTVMGDNLFDMIGLRQRPHWYNFFLRNIAFFLISLYLVIPHMMNSYYDKQAMMASASFSSFFG